MNLFRRLETIFAAAAFAEEGEFDTAKKMMESDSNHRTGRGEDACSGQDCLVSPVRA